MHAGGDERSRVERGECGAFNLGPAARLADWPAMVGMNGGVEGHPPHVGPGGPTGQSRGGDVGLSGSSLDMLYSRGRRA